MGNSYNWQGTCFRHSRSRRKMSRLRRPRILGFAPQVSNLSSGAIVDCALAAIWVKWWKAKKKGRLRFF